MQTVKLNFNKFNLGELTFNGSEYIFKINEESKKMLLKTGNKVALFDTNKQEVKSKELFLPFKRFLPDDENKQKMLESLGVLKTDNDFEKLLKISKFNLSQDTFWLEYKN